MLFIFDSMSIRLVRREKSGANVKQGEKRQRKPN